MYKEYGKLKNKSTLRVEKNTIKESKIERNIKKVTSKKMKEEERWKSTNINLSTTNVQNTILYPHHCIQ